MANEMTSPENHEDRVVVEDEVAHVTEGEWQRLLDLHHPPTGGHPENLIGHLVNDHHVRPWSILGSRIGQEEQHRNLHNKEG